MPQIDDRIARVLNILIADDHALIRKGLLEILRSAKRPATVGEAATAQETLDMSRAQSWDVIILDISMPGASGVETLARLKREQPDRPVIMHSMHDNAIVIRKCLAMGASGYVLKESATDELLAAIEAVLKGEIYLSADVPALLATARSASTSTAETPPE